jgi:DNA adenine methylase
MFLKWAGGKRWLTSRLSPLGDQKFDRYFEPFLGGGAMFFFLKPETAILSDLNSDLINTYEVVRDNPQRLLDELRKHHKAHSKEYYYEIRRKRFRSTVKQAAKFIYLNRAGWNGLYRVNKSGDFNVPIGTERNIISTEIDYLAASEALQETKLKCQDFAKTISQAKEGDLVFADPPYTVNHNKNGFLSYNEKIFSWKDQQRLAKSLENAARRGVRIISTNADHDSITHLYNFADKITLKRTSLLTGDPKYRGRTSEVIFCKNISINLKT